MRITDQSVLCLPQRHRDTFNYKQAEYYINIIIANLTEVINGLGYSLEDLSDNPDTSTTPMYKIFFNGIDHEEGFGGDIIYLFGLFSIRVLKKNILLSDARDSQVTIIHALRDAITIDALNINEFLETKIINDVNHIESNTDYVLPISIVDYTLKIKYREEDYNV